MCLKLQYAAICGAAQVVAVADAVVRHTDMRAHTFDAVTMRHVHGLRHTGTNNPLLPHSLGPASQAVATWECVAQRALAAGSQRGRAGA